MHHMSTMTYFTIAMVIIAIVFTIAILISAHFQEKKEQEIREGILENVHGGDFIPASVFEENWIVGGGRGRSGFAGYKHADGPGCYIILIFVHEVADGDLRGFDDVYVGQSVNMCKRVHAHFNGKGNGDVYADIRNGKHAYVQFRPCDKSEMNDLEKSLIDALGATRSYNNTRGGSAGR